MEVVRVEALPEAPLEAAADFHARVLPGLPRDADLLLVFAPADRPHRLWRLAAVQELARAAAPHRVNGVAAATEAGLRAVLALIDSGKGITGQYLVLDEVSVVLEA
jgi:hypothetical protein